MVKEKKPISAKEISFKGRLPLPTIHQTLHVLEESKLIEKDREEYGETYWKAVPKEKANRLISEYIDEILNEVYGR